MTEIGLVVLFMLLGIIFLLLELFIIPGISIGGMAGLAFVIASVWYAFSTLGTTAGGITLACGVVAMAVAVWIFMRSRTLDKMSLKTEIDSSVDLPKDAQVAIGERGVALSRLAPIGTARFADKMLEVKSLDGLIDPNTEIEIVAVSGETISVQKAK